jgi:hypothetical protein
VSNSKRNKDKDTNNQNEDDELPPPKLATVKRLEELATSKLGEILRNYAAGKKGWMGYDGAEITAARQLLDRDVDNQK